MGTPAFDDLIPKRKGAFDDLIPQRPPLATLKRPTMPSESTGTRATLRNASPAEVAKNRRADLTALKGTAREFAQGATFGLADEAEAGLRALGPRTYADLSQEIGTERDQFRDEHGGLAIAANVAGGLVTGGAAAKAIPGLAALKAPGANLMRVGGRMYDATAKGAAMGLVSGGASARDGERMQGALAGAAFGGVGGGVMGGAAEGVGKLARLARGLRAGEQMTPAIEEAGQTRVLANLARTKQTPEALASWHASADPADIIAEGIGPRGVRQLGTANRHGYQTDDIVTALDSRAADEGARFANVIEKAGGKTARDAATVKQEAFDAIATKRNKLYNKAYQRPDVDAPEVAQVAAELAQMKDGRAALQRASDLAVGKNQLQDWESGSSKISVANLHNLREGIDHAIDVAQAHGDDQMVRALSMRRSVVDNAFKNAGGKAARQADKLHQQAAQLGESFAAGEKLAQGAIPQARNAEGIAAFASNASDPDAFAHGIVSDFATRAASTPSGVGGQPQNPAKIVNSGLAQLRLRQGLPDDQAMTTVMDAARGATNRMKTRVKVLGNSDTAERLADDAMEVGAPIKQLTAATRNPVSAALNYAGSGLDALRRRATGAELDEAAKILMAGAPGQMSRADAIQMLQAAGPRISRKMLTRGNVQPASQP